MQMDPMQEWQRLTAEYRDKSDTELQELAADFNDLTGEAQQALRDEMKTRGLPEPGKAQPKETTRMPRNPEDPAAIHWEPARRRWDGILNEQGADQPHEYTWKTQLCECSTTNEAWQLAEALRRAGIDSWIEAPQRRYGAFDLVYPRILVAADQLDEAREVADRPIPQDIVDEANAIPSETPEFVAPSCRFCGASDPVLLPNEEEDEAGENSQRTATCNRWLCEACGREWSDAEEESSAEEKH